MKITLKKQGLILVPFDEEELKKLNKLSDSIYEVDIKNLDNRTVKQNAALHLWCNQLSKVLNSKSMYMTGVFGNDIEWTMDLVKTQIVKATIKKVFNINSTTKLKKKELDELIDFVTVAFSSKQVEIPPFPSKELWND